MTARRHPSERARRRLGGAAAFAIVVALSVSVAAGASVDRHVRGHAHRAPAIRKRSIQLRPGLSLTVIRYTRQPNEVRILTITPSLGPTLDVQPGRDAYPIYAPPSSVAARHGDAAIVNAAFSVNGVPTHASLIDGELWTSGMGTADAMALTPRGERAFIGKPSLSIVAQPQGGTAFDVTNWNARLPKKAGVSAYTSRGGNIVPPPGALQPTESDPAWCAARLVPTTTIAWTGHRAGITRAYTVEDLTDPCSPKREIVGAAEGAVVLAGRAGTPGGRVVRALTLGEMIHLTWSFAGWPGVTDVIGGEPILVSHGRNVAPRPTPTDPYFFYDNPRTAAGVSAGCLDTTPTTVCRITLVTVDGRRMGWSNGWLLRQLAGQFLRRSVVRALNFDGGGSTEMWVRKRGRYCRSYPAAGGCLVDRPSGVNGERPTTISLGVLPGTDPGGTLP
jgi:hypothetical protein